MLALADALRPDLDVAVIRARRGCGAAAAGHAIAVTLRWKHPAAPRYV